MTVSVSQAQSVRQALAAVPSEHVWRFSVGQYHQMIRAGILTKEDQVELLKGWLISKMPKNPPHRIATKLTRQSLESVVPAGWYVDSQEPITLDDSEPEPDAIIVRGDTRDYQTSHPTAKDVALVVEIADATLERDRELKKQLYASAGISVYWIVNLVENRLEVYSQPAVPTVPTVIDDEPDYSGRQDYNLGDAVPVLIEGNEVARIAVSDLFP